MRVGSCVPPVGGLRQLGVLVLAATLIAGCSSKRDERAGAADAGSGSEAGDVLAEFEAWAKGSGADQDATDGTSDLASAAPDAGNRDAIIERINSKVSTCWKQPFGMPRLATVRLLVQFNPDGTVRSIAPNPEASEALRYRTEAPYLVMVAQTSRALRQCQPYELVRQNYPQYSQLEMTFDPPN